MDDLRNALATTLRDRVGWPADTAAQIVRYAHVVPYEKGATIFHAGQSTDLLYLLVSGDVRLYYGAVGGERLLVSFVRGGEMFGVTNFHAPDARPEQQQQVRQRHARAARSRSWHRPASRNNCTTSRALNSLALSRVLIRGGWRCPAACSPS